MKSFKFNLQRFATQTINASESQTLAGVTYTAVDGAATLNLDDNGKVSGLASGKVSAVVSGASNSPTVTFDATNNAFNFTATSDGKVISITPFPIEFISGNFTYNGGRIDITAGSDLALVTQRGDFILRNENHFVTDSAYIFTSTSLTSDSEHVISYFSLTNGDDVRELNLEQLGTVINHFDQQGVTLVEGSSEVLNIGDYKLTATATDGDAGLNFELGEDGMTFVPNTGDGKLTVALTRGDTTIFGGVLECTSGSITFGYDHAVTFAKDTSFNFTTPNNTVLTVTANGEATTAIALTDNGITFTPGSGDGGLDISLSKKGTKVFDGSLNITDGTITFDTTEKKFSFTDGTKIALGLFGLEMEIEVVGNTTVGSGSSMDFNIAADDSGNLIFTPDTNNGGSFNIALKRDGSTSSQNVLEATTDDDDLVTFFENNVTVNGPIMFNLQTGLLTLMDGTEISIAFDNYTMTATADGDAASKISLTASGISITPQQGDGKLKLALGSAQGSMSVDLEVLSGGFVFGENGALNVVEGTELQLKFSDDYIVKFKTTDAAGGALSIGADGLTFAPNSEDGGLELSVTRNGETRTASLDVTGSLTYKLDGSITLAKGTVVKNVFEDGNILTITANTDASGSITFNPQTGLTITPATADALNIVLTTGDLNVVNISSIEGSINYSGGVITASDGTKARISYYFGWESDLYTTGGTASIQFTDDRTIYTANEGSTFTVDYLDGTTTEIQNGSYADVYGENIEDYTELVSEGTTLRSNDAEVVFTLEKAGNYTLNGMNVTTTVDGVQVQLGEDSIAFGEHFIYTPLDENVTLTVGENSIACAGGKANVNMGLIGAAFDFDTTSGSFTFDRTNNTFSVEKGTVISMAQGNSELQVTALEDTSATIRTDDEGIIYCDWANTTDFTLSLVRDGQTVIALPASLTGTTSYLPSAGTFALVYNRDNSTNATATIGLANYEIQLTTPDTTFIVGLETSDDGKVTINYPREEYSKMNLVVTRDDTAIFGGALSVDGSVVLDPTNRTLTLKDGTSTEMAFSGYTLKATANGDATSAFAIVDEGLVITPNTGDGTLQLEIGTGTASMTAELEVLSGSFTLKQGGVLNIAKDTEVQLTFSDDYSVKFKTTDDAGGDLSLGTDGLTFTPGTDDGSLELSVTKDGVTRTTSLNMTGSLTYKLDGSITLAKDTVVRNVFEDGNILTITALTDASGSIVFTPEGGLSITPSTANALTVALTTGDLEVAQFSSITGTINYSGGLVTVSDGAAADLLVYGEWATKLSTSGGTASLEFTDDRTVYTANEGATFVLDYLDGSTVEIQNGSFSDIYATETEDAIELISEGSNFKANDDEFVFTLEKAGNYTLNGIDITTSEDNVQVVLSDYDTITYDGMTFTGAGNVSLTADNVVLGAGVEATGFGEGNSFVLTEAGNVTVDGKVFELIEDIPLGITVTSAEEGFTFASTLTEEAVQRADKDESLVGKVFTEKFISAGDSSYRVQAELRGLLEVNGISGGTTMTGGAELDGTANEHGVYVVTESDGTFTVADKTYTIAGDSEVTIETYFDTDDTGALIALDGLSGTVSGDFTAKVVSINGSSLAVQAFGDNSIDIVADDNGYEIFGLDAGARLQVSAAGTYKVNGINFNAKAGEYINAGKGGYDIIDDFTSDEIVTVTSSGNQDIDLGKADYDVAYIESDATGNKNVTLGGGNLAVVEDTGAKVNITASKGNDTIISSGKKVFVSLLGGKTDIFELEGKMTVAGYNASTGSGFHTGYEDILTAIKDDAINFYKGKLTIASAVVDFDTDNLLINFFDSNYELQKVGYVSSDESLNLSKEKADLILLAEENSTVTGGSGNDSIYAFEGSHVDGGAGKNYIELEPRTTNEQGAAIALSDGRNTIANFKSGFDYESDKLFFGVNDAVAFKFDGTDLKVKVNGELRGVVSEIADDASFVNFLIEDANGTEKVVTAQENAVITADDELADFYSGDKSGVDFTNYDGELMLNLGSQETSIGAGEVLFSGINQITAGGGLNYLIGSADKETLAAGTGANTINGGAGNDLLVGNTSSEKDDTTEFVFETGGGRDTISNFEFLTDSNLMTADKISVGAAVTNVVLKESGDVIIQTGEDWLTLKDAQGKKFQINDLVATVDKNALEFDGTTNYFLATGTRATLTVGEDVGDEAIIWLGNQRSNQFVGDFKTIDASNSTARTELAGNDLDNTITAGYGDASLWGGNVGDDLLFGGAGKNMFFYALGNGNDTASGTNDGDIVYLSGITLEQIIGTSFTDGAVNVKFSDGGQLTVNDDGKAVDFVVGEQTFRVNSEHTAFTTEINA